MVLDRTDLQKHFNLIIHEWVKNYDFLNKIMKIVFKVVVSVMDFSICSYKIKRLLRKYKACIIFLFPCMSFTAFIRNSMFYLIFNILY